MPSRNFIAFTFAREVQIPKRMPFACALLIVSFVKAEIDLSLWKRVPSKSERMIEIFSIFNYGEVQKNFQVIKCVSDVKGAAGGHRRKGWLSLSKLPFSRRLERSGTCNVATGAEGAGNARIFITSISLASYFF